MKISRRKLEKATFLQMEGDYWLRIISVEDTSIICEDESSGEWHVLDYLDSELAGLEWAWGLYKIR